MDLCSTQDKKARKVRRHISNLHYHSKNFKRRTIRGIKISTIAFDKVMLTLYRFNNEVKKLSYSFGIFNAPIRMNLDEEIFLSWDFIT